MKITEERGRVTITGLSLPQPLTFTRQEVSIGPDETWVSEWRREGHIFGRDYYRVYQWKTGFAVSRPPHPILGEFEEWRDTRRLAMMLCAQDWEVVQRLRRWEDYMKTHEPPAQFPDE